MLSDTVDTEYTNWYSWLRTKRRWDRITLWPRVGGRHELLHMDVKEYFWVRMGSGEEFTVGVAGNGPCRRLLRLLYRDARRAHYRLTVRRSDTDWIIFEYRPV